jgi:hypothetical protein
MAAPAAGGPALDAPASPEPPPPDAAAATGYLVIHNDVWCNLWIDGNFHGNRRNEPIEIGAGRHTVRCVNPAVGEWTQTAEVAPGATQTLTGTLLRELEVTLEVDATIDGRRYARGRVVKLKPGNVEVIPPGRPSQRCSRSLRSQLRAAPAVSATRPSTPAAAAATRPGARCRSGSRRRARSLGRARRFTSARR